MNNVIAGIDLGTTFSALAYLNEIGKPEIVPNADGERMTPSALYFTEGPQGKILVGTEAINARMENPDRSVRWIKRYMGEEKFPQPILGKDWTPAELSSVILKKLKNDCSIQIGPVQDVVITVPAHFDEVRRKATMEAGTIAGLNVIGIVNEPSAAALFYATTKKKSGRVVVFDLGGGTFDVTILDVDGQNCDFICSQGDHRLGGYDFDQKIIELFDETYKTKYGCALIQNDWERISYEKQAEDAKRALSKREKIKEILVGDAGRMTIELTRERFEEAISSYLARIEMLVETALEEASMKPEEADAVLLVGGSTRIPIVKKRLEKIFDKEPTGSVNVDEAVALGAAIKAGLITLEHDSDKLNSSMVSSLSEISFADVCNASYGTICVNDDPETGRKMLMNDILLKKNSRIPCEVTKTYYTVVDNQEEINVEITQGENADPEYVSRIAQEDFHLPPNRPAGRPIEVTYKYDDNQRMHCMFRDVESGRYLEMDIDTKTGSSSSNKGEKQKRTSLDDFVVE
jgi:molecular chaperone DnaK